MDNLPQNAGNVKPEIRLTYLDYAYLDRLKWLRWRFQSKGTARKDGSIFQSNKKLFTYLRCTEPGLIKSRKRLIAAAKIRFKRGGGRRRASYYWILDASERLGPLDPDMVKDYVQRYGLEATKAHFLRQGYAEYEVDRVLGKL